jgi:hypothetical protein
MFTGRRVIGLSTSTNAARVLQQEIDDAGAELAESFNIAEFLGKVEGSDELRRPIPLHENDVLVLDEATQASTADLAMIQEAAKQAGARLNPVGDTEQLGSPEAGGMFELLAQEVPSAELHEVRRFDAPWGADASVRLRSGDFTAIAAYDTRGRIRGPTRKPPTSAPRAAGWPTICKAKTFSCWPARTRKPPSWPGGYRPGSPSSARSGQARLPCLTGTTPGSVT